VNLLFAFVITPVTYTIALIILLMSFPTACHQMAPLDWIIAPLSTELSCQNAEFFIWGQPQTPPNPPYDQIEASHVDLSVKLYLSMTISLYSQLIIYFKFWLITNGSDVILSLKEYDWFLQHDKCWLDT